jgi:lipoprotein-releasing system ATP-binding protein
MERVAPAAGRYNSLRIGKTMEDRVIIKAENLEKIYGYGRNALRVLKGISLEILRGEIISIVGPSGAGKSTLLNLVGCLDTFQGGSLKILDRDITNLSAEALSGFRNWHIGFIFQLHNLLPEFNALENVMMPLFIRRANTRDAKAQALALLERFNLSDRVNHKPSELSGGECQRIAVARAIVTGPDILLADEPTGNLDRANSRMLTDMLLEMGRERGTTIVIVTHDKDIAARTGKTITLIDGNIQKA